MSRVFKQDEFRQEPTGICYVLKDKMRKFEEHSPCRNCKIIFFLNLSINNSKHFIVKAMWGHHRQGYCQAGFSAAISKV